MIYTTGIIRLNPSDSTLLDSPTINITATANYLNGRWDIEVFAKAETLFNYQPSTVVRKYQIAGEQMIPLAQGTSNFASDLGRIIEEMIAADLRSINPEATLTVQV
jgi:hypothetical protein